MQLTDDQAIALEDAGASKWSSHDGPLGSLNLTVRDTCVAGWVYRHTKVLDPESRGWAWMRTGEWVDVTVTLRNRCYCRHHDLPEPVEPPKMTVEEMLEHLRQGPDSGWELGSWVEGCPVLEGRLNEAVRLYEKERDGEADGAENTTTAS